MAEEVKKEAEENLNETNQQEHEYKKNSVGDYFRFGDVATYFFRRKDPNRPSNFNIKAMHTINKISITMFLIAIIFFILKKIL